jgi:hypothetical protein
MKEKIKAIAKLIAGIIAIPIVFIIGIIDRCILLFLFWQESPSVGVYFRKTKQLYMAAWRFAGILALYGLAQLLKWIINGI